MIRRIVVAWGLVGQGCYCSHELGPVDARGAEDTRHPDSSGPDAVEPADASEDPEGPFWVPVDVASFSIAHERCETRETQTLVLRVTFTTDGCDEPGNLRWTLDRTAREIVLAPFVWRRMGAPPCPPSTREIARDVALRGVVLAAGPWQIVSPDGSRLTIEIAPRSTELTCADCRAEGESCVDDDECASTHQCVPVRGDLACAARCASSCQPFMEREDAPDLACNREISEARACIEDANLGWTCAPVVGSCDVCPDGMACNGRHCDWTVTPWPESCRTDADCPLGRSCVQIADGSARTCFVRCRGDHPCPLGEECGPTGVVCPSPKI